MHLKLSSAKRRPFRLGPNELSEIVSHLLGSMIHLIYNGKFTNAFARDKYLEYLKGKTTVDFQPGKFIFLSISRPFPRTLNTNLAWDAVSDLN